MSVERSNRVVELLRSELRGLEEEIARRVEEGRKAEIIASEHWISPSCSEGYGGGSNSMTSSMKIDQTILGDDPIRHGNCFAACVATALGKPLKDIPHFVEWGQQFHNGKVHDQDDADRKHWWAMFLGYTFALGLMPEKRDTIDDSEPGEILFVAGLSPRGIMHQVLYRDGQLWHDPHPSRAGLASIDEDEIFSLRPVPDAGHDHDPTPQKEGATT